MKTLLEKYLPLRAPEGGGGGGDGGAAAAAAGGDPAQAGGAAAANGEAGPDAAAAAAAAAAGSAGYRPEGLPDTMFGKDDKETIDKLHGAVKGYRDRDAARVVPEKADAYNAFEVDKLVTDLKLDDAVKPHLQELANPVNKPIMDAVSAFALEQKLPVAQVQGLIGVAYAAAQKAGAFDFVIDEAKEREALLPEAAKSLSKADQDKAIDARMQENEDWIKLLSKPVEGGKPLLDAKVGEHTLLMLMDTAAGNQFLEFVRGQMTGAGKDAPQLGNGSAGGGADARAQLAARAGLPENTFGNPKFDRASWDALQADYQKLVTQK